MLLHNLSMITNHATSSSNSIKHTVACILVKILQKLPLARSALHSEDSNDRTRTRNKAAFLSF